MAGEGTIKYNSPTNVQVADENGVFHRAQLVAAAPGEIRFNDPDNSPNVQVADENGVFHRAQLVAMIGGGGGSVNENRIIIKSDTIPTASESTYGKFYCYSGVTNNSYTHGYIYECVADSTINTSISLQQSDEYEVNKLAFDSDNYTVESFFEFIASLSTPTFDASEVATGTLVFDGLNEIWSVSGSDAEGNVLFSNFTIDGTGSASSLDALGFVYIAHFPDDYPDGYTEDYTITRTEVLNNYRWERMDVQPALSVGRYLSNWNAATGLAATNPQESPYEYKAGDYFIVGTVASSGSTNYRPDGSAYVIGQASTTVESSPLTINDMYLYDGTNWLLLKTGNTVTSINGQTGDVVLTGADLTTLVEVDTATLTQELANDTIYDCGEMTSITLTLPATMDAKFISQLNFTSGSTPTVPPTAPNTVVWLGNDITGGGFVPVANKRYCVLFFYDGTAVRGLVQGA